jgi:diacylglycerol kinase family enzyme
VNILAKEAGIPPSVRGAVDAHLGGQKVRIDLGRADGEPFLLMASAGWDARVVRDVSLGLKRRVGDLAYVLKAVALVPRLRPEAAAWTAGELRCEDELAILLVSNTRLYGGRVHVAPLAMADDGLLDVVALCPRNPLQALRLAGRVLTGRAASDARAFSARVPEIVLETPGIAVQLDGDYAGESPVRFTVDPGALLLSIPAGEPPAILSSARHE